MESRHYVQIGGKGFALAAFKLLDEVVHSLLDEYLCGVVSLCRALLIGRIAAISLRRIFTVRRGIAAAHCPIAGSEGCGAGIADLHMMLLWARCGADWRPKRKSTQPNFFR
jgi:hypothetical protein